MKNMIILASKLPTEEDITSALFPNLYTIIATILAFILIFIFLIYFFYKPVKKNINERQEYIKNNINSSEKMLNDAIDKVEALEELKRNNIKKAKEIIYEAQKSAFKKEEAIIFQAKSKSKDILVLAEQESIKIKQKMESNLQQKIVDSAILISQKVVGKEIDAKKIEKLIVEEMSKK